MIMILSGPVRSYKTTTLMHWVEDRVDCGGVLSPDVDGLRCLYNVKEKIHIPWQKIRPDSFSDIIIGRFAFDAEAFHEAREWLTDHLTDDAVQYLILDEVGPLELAGEGWDSWLITSLEKIGEKTLILVTRETLIGDVVKHYGIEGCAVVGKEYFVL